MLRQLDKLEADLHAGTAQVDVYAQLVQRHGQAQQIACQVTNDHVQEITRLANAQLRKRQEKLRQRRAVAQLVKPAAGGRAVASR
jgi:hypothetical protein